MCTTTFSLAVKKRRFEEQQPPDQDVDPSFPYYCQPNTLTSGDWAFLKEQRTEKTMSDPSESPASLFLTSTLWSQCEKQAGLGDFRDSWPLSPQLHGIYSPVEDRQSCFELPLLSRSVKYPARALIEPCRIFSRPDCARRSDQY
jgi:hypothetical protein